MATWDALEAADGELGSQVRRVRARFEATGLGFLRPDGDHLVIEWWTEGAGYERVDRA
jgi:hypothetical protein